MFIIDMLQQGLKDGYFEVTNVNVRIMGPPRVGKTAFLHFLLNWTAPKEHHSTPIGSRPVRAIVHIADINEGKQWSPVNAKDMLATMVDATKDIENRPSTTSTGIEELPPKIEFISQQNTPTSRSTITAPTSTVTATTSTVTSPTSTITTPIATIQLPTTAITTDGSHHISDDDDDDNDETPQPKPIQDRYTSQMLKLLKKRKKQSELHKATWINLLDLSLIHI